MSANALLTVNQLSCTRGERVLFSGLSFKVQSGEVLQILGSNGAGKTSFLRMKSPKALFPEQGMIYFILVIDRPLKRHSLSLKIYLSLQL